VQKTRKIESNPLKITRKPPTKVDLESEKENDSSQKEFREVQRVMYSILGWDLWDGFRTGVLEIVCLL
jgi:hypothetical protein